MTDLSKTSGSSPPKNFCDPAPTIYVTRENHVEYRDAVNAYWLVQFVYAELCDARIAR
jgi:hypothetical protein